MSPKLVPARCLVSLVDDATGRTLARWGTRNDLVRREPARARRAHRWIGGGPSHPWPCRCGPPATASAWRPQHAQRRTHQIRRRAGPHLLALATAEHDLDHGRVWIRGVVALARSALVLATFVNRP